MRIKILDRYVAKNFLIGYAIAFLVLVGMRILIDLSVNVDEFTENKAYSTSMILANIFEFYRVQSLLYFRDFAGIITVVAAVFSLGNMTKKNELIAVMASGISLKRIIMPIIVLSIALTALLVVDQEVLIPNKATELTKSHDEIRQDQTYRIVCMTDSNSSILNASSYNEATHTLTNPSIILKKEIAPNKWKTVGWITADKAVYDESKKSWRLSSKVVDPETKEVITTGGILQKIVPPGDDDVTKTYSELKYYKSDLTPQIIPIRKEERFTSFLSSAQLERLARNDAKVHDKAKLYMQKHTRITDPLINFIMLLVALPILVCRDNKAMKSAIMISFGTTMACFIIAFVSKLIGTEVFLGKIRPVLFAWLPILIFMPIAMIELDSMKT